MANPAVESTYVEQPPDSEQLEIEKKWQKFWKDNKCFEQEGGKFNRDLGKFFGTVAYPYANSALHIGHGRMNTAADIVMRYQRLLGKNVFFPMGFHISGTPVLAVADAIKRRDEKQIAITRAAISEYIQDKAKQDELLQSFEDPFKIADFFSSLIEDTFHTIGLSIDWTKKFSTGDLGYQQFIEWQMRKLDTEAKILERGKYPILYSPADDNAVGEDDIKDGDTDKVTILEMSYILFPFALKEGDAAAGQEPEYFAVASLRPDALFGATNLWIDPEGEVSRVQVTLCKTDSSPGYVQTWLVGKLAVAKLQYQFDDVKVLSEHKGAEFVGRTLRTPLTNRDVPLTATSFLDPRHGTGLVYSSHAGSPHDFMALKEAQAEGRVIKDIKVINTVKTKDKKGKITEYNDKVQKFKITKSTDPKLEECKQEVYKEEHYGGVLDGDAVGTFAGTPIKSVKDAVHKALVEAKLGGTLYETSRRAVTRANDMVIVANLRGQWFLDYSSPEVKTKAKAVLDKMKYMPDHLKNSQQGQLDWVQKRPCARRRGIGTKLPQDPEWLVEPLSDSTIYQMYYPLAGYLNSGKIKVEHLNTELLDWVFLDRGDTPAFLDKALATEIKETCRYWGGIDLRYTAPTHMSNHLSFLIYHYALILPELFHPQCITIGGLLLRNGEKISKAKGNGIPLIQVRERFGADLYRLYIAVGTSFDAEFDFRESEIPQYRTKFETWKKIMRDVKGAQPLDSAKFERIDRWLVSRFYSRSLEFFKNMEEIRFRDAYVSMLFEFVKEINYHTRRTDFSRTTSVMRTFFVDYLKLMAPAVPHICEELFAGEDGSRLVSLSAWDKSTTKNERHDAEAEGIEAVALELVGQITIDRNRQVKMKNAAASKGGGKGGGGADDKKGGGADDEGSSNKMKKITVVQACDEMYKIFDELKGKLASTPEGPSRPKDIMSHMKKAFPAKEFDKFLSQFIPKTLGIAGIQYYASKEMERAYLESVQAYLSAEYQGTPVEFATADHPDFQNKKTLALPGTPAVSVELA